MTLRGGRGAPERYVVTKSQSHRVTQSRSHAVTRGGGDVIGCDFVVTNRNLLPLVSLLGL